jgi:hypothetical protein
MKRIFKMFLSEVNPHVKDLSKLTTEFNHWVQNATNEHGFKRFYFKAYTTKHTIRKWIEFEIS